MNFLFQQFKLMAIYWIFTYFDKQGPRKTLKPSRNWRTEYSAKFFDCDHIFLLFSLLRNFIQQSLNSGLAQV